MAIFGDYGARLPYQLGGEVRFDAASNIKHSYVRVECYGPGGRMAWTQSFAIRRDGERLTRCNSHDSD